MEFLAQASPQQPPSVVWTLLVPFMFMALILYMMVLRPQRRKENERRELLAKLKKNDRVVLQSGLHGTVVQVKESEVILLVDENKDIKLKYEKDAVERLVQEGEKS